MKNFKESIFSFQHPESWIKIAESEIDSENQNKLPEYL
jgi:hypothetical protein